MSIVGDDPYHNFLGYTVKRNIGISSLGNRFVYFSYGVAVINEKKLALGIEYNQAKF